MTTKPSQAKIEQSKKDLRKLVKPGDTLYVKLNHRSASGMYRCIDVFVIKKNEPLRLSWSVAEVTGLGYDRKHEGVRASGCGMDMGFHVVYELSHALYSKGYKCKGKGKCPSNYHNNYRSFDYCQCHENDHNQRVYDNDEGQSTLCTKCENGKVKNPEPQRYDLVHTDGYALKHRWL